MIDLILAGKKVVVSRERAATGAESRELAALPRFTLNDRTGKTARVLYAPPGLHDEVAKLLTTLTER